jgi:Tfp pilus assembly protein PilV
MRYVLTQKGQSLVEILFAVALFTVGVVTIGYLIFDSFLSLRYSIESTQARLYAAEGMEALHTIADRSFDQVTAGSHGLRLNDGMWVLEGSFDSMGNFSRTITVEEIDTETKEINSLVTWGNDLHPKQISFSTRITNWKQNAGDARDVQYDINNALVSASSTLLSGIAFLNTGEKDAVVTHLKLQWETGALLESVSIRDTVVFNASSSPAVSSGEIIDIDDYVVGSATGFHLSNFSFNSSVAGTDFVLTAIFADESMRHVRISP